MQGSLHRLARVLASPFLSARNALLNGLVRTPAGLAAVLDLLKERDCQIIVNNGNHKVRCFPGDSIGRNLFIKGEWQRDLLQHSIELLPGPVLQDDAIFVDVGANIGTQSIYAHQSGRFKDIVCIEAEPENFKVLKFNLVENRISDRYAFNMGAGIEPAKLRLYRNEKSSGKHSFQKASGDFVEVEVDSVEHILLNAELSLDRVGLVWIDVEGFELQVLKGMSHLLERRCPIVMEFTPRFYGRDGVEEMISLISRYYDRYATFDDDAHTSPIGDLRNITEQTDILLGFDQPKS